MDPDLRQVPYFASASLWLQKRISENVLFREFIVFSLSTGAYQASRLGVNLLAARWLKPEIFGIWNALYLFLLYGALVTLGVPNGMNRQIPLLKGAGKDQLAERVAQSSLLFVLLSGCIGAIVTVSNFIDIFHRHITLFFLGGQHSVVRVTARN